MLQRSLKEKGVAPIDNRGKHHNRPHKLSEVSKNVIRNHIKSFKGRKTHYSLHKTSKLYLPEELNVKKMHNMFSQKFPDVKISYETYRTIFSTEFNIGFGFPRLDTCSQCDINIAKMKGLESERFNLATRGMTESLQFRQVERNIRNLKIEIKLHKLKADQFYKRKREAKISSQRVLSTEAICLDFSKNLPLPNITTNDVYYKRQLSLYSLNIHVLSTSQAIFYTFPETVGNKGSDSVSSLLHHFVFNYLNEEVQHLEIFCDSCGGQNKNYTVFRLLHYIVHVEKRLQSIKLTFPIRGHSYLECDKDFGLINQKSRAEVPEDWIEVFKSARVKPMPFEVVEVEQSNFKNWTFFFKERYRRKCPFPTRPIRELKIVKEHPRLIYYRTTYNGMWESSPVTDPKFKPTQKCRDGEFELPDYLYNGT